MKNIVLMSAALFASSLNGVAHAQTALDKIPELKFESEIIVSNANMPENLSLGEVAGVSTDSKGNIYVYSRTAGAGDIDKRRSAQLFEFGPDGKFMREIGAPNNYIMGWAHSVRIDHDDNIWVVDDGTSLLGKFGQDGRILMALGRRRETVQAMAMRMTENATSRKAVSRCRPEMGSSRGRRMSPLTLKAIFM